MIVMLAVAKGGEGKEKERERRGKNLLINERNQ